MKNLKVLSILLSLICADCIYAQSSQCGTIDPLPVIIPSTGNIKILVIFVKFSNDYNQYNDWKIPLYAQSRPPWTENMLMTNPGSTPSHPSLSGYFKNQSIDRCNIYGEIFPRINSSPNVYIPSYEIEHYQSTNCGGSRGIHSVTYEVLKNLDNVIDYSQYDNFKADGTAGQDGYVDYIIIWFRDMHIDITDCNSYDGIASLTGNFNYFLDENDQQQPTYQTYDGVQIKPDNGCIANGYSPRKIDIMVHEIVHSIGHSFHNSYHYAKWCSGEAVTGVGIPITFEKQYLNWLPNTSNQGSIFIPEIQGEYEQTHVLHDYETTADENGKTIYIEIAAGSKVIKLENRSGLGFYSKLGNWVLPGNGLLAYQNPGILCADHQWNWKTLGLPNCSPNNCPNRYDQLFDFNNGCIKLEPNNDVNGIQDIDLYGICTTVGCGYDIKAEGDAADLYNPDYNTVLSTWSNPSIGPNFYGKPMVIEHLGKNADSSINIKIKISDNAQVGTSPSKPLWLRVQKEYYNPENLNMFHPKLLWLDNTEPDMSAYKIYRCWKNDPGIEPALNEYAYVTQVGENINEWTDNEITLYEVDGSPYPACQYIQRTYNYKIEAMDNEAKSSVKSDRGYVTGLIDPCEGDPSGAIKPVIEKQNEKPLTFSLSNYPNPFNPVTNIQFSIPVQSTVKIKIYNMTGEEISSMQYDLAAGYYSLPFDGSNLSSGIYIYSIEAGSFKESKKMVLIK